MSELNSLNDLDTTDRVFLFSPFYTKEVAQDVQQLIDKDIDFVLVCNRPKQEDFRTSYAFCKLINSASDCIY